MTKATLPKRFSRGDWVTITAEGSHWDGQRGLIISYTYDCDDMHVEGYRVMVDSHLDPACTIALDFTCSEVTA